MPYLIYFRKFKESCTWVHEEYAGSIDICLDTRNKDRNSDRYGLCLEKNCPILGGCKKVKTVILGGNNKYYKEVKK